MRYQDKDGTIFYEAPLAGVGEDPPTKEPEKKKEDETPWGWLLGGAVGGVIVGAVATSLLGSSRGRAANPVDEEVVTMVTWLESIQQEEQIHSALVEMNHRLDHWFLNGKADLCRQLLEQVQPEKLQSAVLVGLLMNSIRGGEALVKPRQAFRKRIEPALKKAVGEARTAKILGRIA